MIDDTNFYEYGQEMIVIREIFDGAHELFENELERALEFGCPTIVIEPCRLGDETARWIWFGEYLTKYSIATGIGSIITGYFWPNKIFIQSSLLGMALLTNGMHLISWQQDICSNYRVEPNPEQYLRMMASQQQPNQQQKDIDTISLVTSTQIDSDNGSSDDNNKQTTTTTTTPLPPPTTQSTTVQQQQSKSHRHYRPTNPYEMILSTSARRQRQPVVLCRRSTNDLQRTKWLNAAVSLLAIAFSFIRLVRSSFFYHSNHPSTITTKSSQVNHAHSYWSSLLKTLI